MSATYQYVNAAVATVLLALVFGALSNIVEELRSLNGRLIRRDELLERELANADRAAATVHDLDDHR